MKKSLLIFISIFTNISVELFFNDVSCELHGSCERHLMSLNVYTSNEGYCYREVWDFFFLFHLLLVDPLFFSKYYPYIQLGWDLIYDLYNSSCEYLMFLFEKSLLVLFWPKKSHPECLRNVYRRSFLLQSLRKSERIVLLTIIRIR